MNTVQAIDIIAVNPNIRSGRPYIMGTTVTVVDIAIVKLYHRVDADGIADWYGLDLTQVTAALAYYYAHKEGIDEQVRTQIRHAQDLKERHVGGQDQLLS